MVQVRCTILPRVHAMERQSQNESRTLVRTPPRPPSFPNSMSLPGLSGGHLKRQGHCNEKIACPRTAIPRTLHILMHSTRSMITSPGVSHNLIYPTYREQPFLRPLAVASPSHSAATGVAGKPTSLANRATVVIMRSVKRGDARRSSVN